MRLLPRDEFVSLKIWTLVFGRTHQEEIRRALDEIRQVRDKLFRMAKILELLGANLKDIELGKLMQEIEDSAKAFGHSKRYRPVQTIVDKAADILGENLFKQVSVSGDLGDDMTPGIVTAMIPTPEGCDRAARRLHLLAGFYWDMFLPLNESEQKERRKKTNRKAPSNDARDYIMHLAENGFSPVKLAPIAVASGYRWRQVEEDDSTESLIADLTNIINAEVSRRRARRK